MVFHKVLGILQLAFVSVFIAFLLGWTDAGMATIAGIYFIFKGFAFTLLKGNIVSLADAVAGSIILFAAFDVFSNIIVSIVVILFLLQKGVTYLFR